MLRFRRQRALVFVNAIGDIRPDRVKDWEIYKSWPPLVAAHGMIGISMDAHRDSVQQSIDGVFKLLGGASARTLGVDSLRLGVYAASANVGGLLSYLQGAHASPAIRSAVLYFGGVPRGALPPIPTLVVVAQGYASRMRPHLDSLWSAVVDSAAPWTLHFARGLPHAFDAVTGNDDARHTIQQTLAFWKSNLRMVRGSMSARSSWAFLPAGRRYAPA